MWSSSKMSEHIYEAVTAQITNALMRGVVPWRKPWRGSQSMPFNAVSKKPYRGINVFLLTLTAYADPRWVTFNQARDLGGNVRKGERAMPVVFWKPWTTEGVDQETGEVYVWKVPLLKRFHVFNVEQCDGLELPVVSEPGRTYHHDRIERADTFVTDIADPPALRFDGTSAWYRPADDLVQMPPLEQFDSADSFYGTLFHELGHATGHEKRLNRASVTGEIQFGSNCYSREELIAELTSAYCCASLGLDNSLIENSASYIQSWLSALRTDKRALVVAASKAQKAADFLFGTSTHDQPV